MKWYERQAASLTIPALLQMPRRAERSPGDALKRTYVDVQNLSQILQIREHQVVYGRRGTGKTHALWNLVETLRSDGETALFLDLRMIGSASGYYGGSTESMFQMTSRVIVDLLEELHVQLLEIALAQLEMGSEVTNLIRGLDDLVEAASSIEVVGSAERTVERSTVRKASDTSALSISTARSALELSATAGVEESSRGTESHSGIERYSLKFGQLSRAFRRIVGALPQGRLWIALDEWSALPIEIQPLVADFLKRCLLPVTGTIVKICAIKSRSRFALWHDGAPIGIELGSDAMQDVDLDFFLSVNPESESARDFYLHLFSHHITEFWLNRGRELGEEVAYLIQTTIPDYSFRRLVVAAGGVPRDAINIASLAAQVSTDGIVTSDHVVEAARRWYLNDKESTVRTVRANTRVLASLRRYAEQSHQRTFLLERHKDSNAPEILDLFDSRIIHLAASGVGLGARYDAYVLDLGLYADVALGDSENEDWTQGWLYNWDALDVRRNRQVREAVLSVASLRASVD